MISVIMPVYNEEKYIKEAIESILSQSYSNIQLIVINDGSTDNTLAILNKIAKSDSRLLVLNPGKLGKNCAINYAIPFIKGDWITTAAGDDILDKEAYQNWIQAIKDYNPYVDKVVVSSRLKMFSEEKKYIKYNGIEIPKNKNEVCKSGAVFLASIAMKDLFFPIPEQLPNEDGWLALCIEYLTDFKLKVPKVAWYYRIHGHNSLNKNAIYEEFNEKYHKRRLVDKYFLDKYEGVLNEKSKKLLLQNLNSEELRYSGNTLKLFLTKHDTLKDKLRNIMLSNKQLYNIKLVLNRILLGW